MKNFSGITDNLDITTKKYVDDGLAGKANLAGNNTFTGGQTITGSNGGYSINASGYVKGSWLQSSTTQNKGSNTGKVCVFDNNGWIYYRTPAEILSEAGGAKSSDIPDTSKFVTTDTDQYDMTGSKSWIGDDGEINIHRGSMTFSGKRDDTQNLGGFDINSGSDNTCGGWSVGADVAHLEIGLDGACDIELNGDAGTSGQVLTSQGASNTPTWQYVTKHGYTELTNEDLNTITEAGWYRAEIGNTCANRPFTSNSAFILIVEVRSSTHIRQTVYTIGGLSNTYKRYTNNGATSWFGWYTYTGIDTSDQAFSGRKTFSSGINLTSSLQVNGSSGTAGQVLTSTGSGAPEWKDVSGSTNDMPTIRLVSVKDTTGTGICGVNNPLRFSFVVESGTLLDTDYVELCSRTLFTYADGHYLNHAGGVEDYGRTYKLRAFHRVVVSNLTNDSGFYKFEIGGTDSNYALRQFVRSNMPTPISKSPYSITKYIRIMRETNNTVPTNIHSNVIPIYVAPTKPIEDASTNLWSAKIRIR